VSRIGRMPITVPAGVQVRQEGNKISVKGAKGELVREFHPAMTISLDQNLLRVSRPDDTRTNKALHGLTRALLANMVAGVVHGFKKQLVIEGVGFRGEQQGEAIVLVLGFSHPVKINPPAGIKLTMDASGRIITVEGSDKEAVGEVAAKVRAVRPPEPYKGVGIAYQGEVIRRKAGKAGKAAAGGTK
jgi:large subunit ribosomal protein L6